MKILKFECVFGMPNKLEKITSASNALRILPEVKLFLCKNLLSEDASFY